MIFDKGPNIIGQKLATELYSVTEWLIWKNKLSLYAGKCESIWFTSKPKCAKVANFNVVYNGTTIEAKSKVTYPGKTIYCSLSEQNNVSNIISKWNGKLKFLYRHKWVLNTTMCKSVYIPLMCVLSRF